MSTSGPSRIGAQMPARQDGLGLFRRGLPLFGDIALGLLLVVSVSAAVTLRARAGERALRDYDAGARDVTVEALAGDLIAYLGQRVHIEGWSVAVSHADGAVLLTLSGIAVDESGDAGLRILVIAPEDVSITARQEAEVWGVVEPAAPGSGQTGSPATMVTVRARFVHSVSR